MKDLFLLPLHKRRNEKTSREIFTMDPLPFFLLFTAVMMTSSSAQIQPSSCQTQCGDIDIPYPFGIGDGCYAKDYPGDFSVNCSGNSTAFLGSGNIPIIYIDIQAGEVRVNASTGFDCYDERGGRNYSFPWFTLGDPFTFSNRKNLFVVIGCDTYARINGVNGVSYSGGCISYCENLDSFAGLADGTCSGLGCCQVSIPRGLKSYKTEMKSDFNYSRSMSFNRCGYIFLGEEGEYEFNVDDLSSEKLKTQTLPLALDWSIGNMTCEQANSSRTVPYACRSENSTCVESNNGVGYYCNCASGYEGNPFLPGGCKGTFQLLERLDSR